MRPILALAVTLIVSIAAAAQTPSSCDACPAWNAPQAPVRIFGNTYYVGPRGLSAILITSDEGHVLVDAALPESVPGIVERITSLGFRVEDIALILNSHPHFDHAGGIADMQRLSGASVAARRPSVRVLEQGRAGRDDPQFGVALPMRPVPRVTIVEDGATLQVGPIRLTAHATAGHTPGGTSWSWRSCEGARCLDLVYADSLTAVAADGFLFTSSTDYPTALADFERAFSTIGSLRCDILLTPHPDLIELWEHLARREGGDPDALIDRGACRRYVEGARERLRTRVEREQKTP